MNQDKSKRATLNAIRPVISTDPTSSDVERFQNETLRPILKLQHDLLIGIFQHYIEQRKGVFHKLIPKEQLNYIQHSIQKDSRSCSQKIWIQICKYTLYGIIVCLSHSNFGKNGFHVFL